MTIYRNTVINADCLHKRVVVSVFARQGRGAVRVDDQFPELELLGGGFLLTGLDQRDLIE